MKLQHLVDTSIYKYSLLFRTRNDPKLSRLRFLNHLFLAFGTGYSWDKEEGILVDLYEKEIDFAGLPEGFYEKELYALDIEPEIEEDLIKELGPKYFYRTSPDLSRLIRVAFECNQEDADAYAQKWMKRDYDAKFIFAYGMETTYPYVPCQISEFSPISEVTAGRTHGFMGSENFDFTNYPVDSEWLAGMIEVAQFSRAFYNDPEQCKHHPSYPNKNKHYYFEYKKAEELGRLEELRNNWNYKENETFSERLERKWKTDRDRQVLYLDEFLAKFT